MNSPRSAHPTEMLFHMHSSVLSKIIQKDKHSTGNFSGNPLHSRMKNKLGYTDVSSLMMRLYWNKPI